MDSTTSSNPIISISDAATTASDAINQSLFSFEYWFSTPAAADFSSKLSFAAVLSSILILMVLALFVFKLGSKRLSPPKKKFIEQALWWTFAFGPVGWLLVLARYFGLDYLSARFLWILWLFSLVGVGFILFSLSKKLPKAEKQYQSYQIKKRYFPKKKGK